MKKHQRGFTLLELLMVVIIIAILAAIAVPQYFRAAERSRAAEALQILGSMRGAEIRYKAQSATSIYTNVLDDLDIAAPGATGASASTMWTYAISGTGAGSNVTATRSSGTTKGGTIEIDLDSGATCAPSNGTTYGLSNAAC